MKVKVTKQELRECIKHAVIRAINETKTYRRLNEDSLDDFDFGSWLADLNNDVEAQKAMKAAQKDMQNDSSMQDSEDDEFADEPEEDYGDGIQIIPMTDENGEEMISPDEINSFTRHDMNDERIKGISENGKFIGRGKPGYVAAFRRWLSQREVDNADHEGQWGYKPKDMSDEEWANSPKNHDKMLRKINKNGAEEFSVPQTTGGMKLITPRP